MSGTNFFHSAHGAAHFLGLRHARSGAAEIVYDDGAATRMIFRVVNEVADDRQIREALQRAVSQVRVLPALFTELKRRAIAVEAVGG